MPGLEEVAWREIKSRFPRAKFVEYLFAKDQNGIIIFESREQAAALLELRTIEDLFIQVASAHKLSRDWGDLRKIAGLITESDVLETASKTVQAAKNLETSVSIFEF